MKKLFALLLVFATFLSVATANAFVPDNPKPKQEQVKVQDNVTVAPEIAVAKTDFGNSFTENYTNLKQSSGNILYTLRIKLNKPVRSDVNPESRKYSRKRSKAVISTNLPVIEVISGSDASLYFQTWRS